MPPRTSSGTKRNVRVADAKEVGVGNPAEETYCHPNTENLRHLRQICQLRNLQDSAPDRNLIVPPPLGGKARSEAPYRHCPRS
jgi:hypothetical protein